MHLSLGPKLALAHGLAPDLQQGLAILELGHAALAVELRAACEANPALEEVMEDDAFEHPGAEANDLGPADRFDEPSRDDLDSDAWMNRLEEFPGSMASGEREQPDREWHEKEPVALAVSLLEHLREQIALSNAPGPIRQVAQLVAGCLDEDGLLEASRGEIFDLAKAEGVPEVDEACVEQALSLVRGLDPAGVGWWTRQESLAAQLRLRGVSCTDVAMRLLTETWEDFIAGRWGRVAKRLGVTPEAVEEGRVTLRGLEHRPGARFARREGEGLVADVIVREVEGRLLIETSDRGLPRLRLSAGYRNLWRRLGRSDEDAEARRFLADRFKSARTLLGNVQRRGDTLRRIVELVFDCQPDFLERGLAGLRPLSMTEVAGLLELSISTVSRAVENKQVATPRGTLPLRAFFSSGLTATEGEAATGSAVRERMRALVAAEPAAAPLTDKAIQARLRRNGTEIALSTVTKYRKCLGIPATHIRRQLRIAG